MYCHIHHCHYHHCNCVPKDNKENGKALTQEELVAYTQEMKEELKDYTVDLKDQIFSYIDIGLNPVEIANTFASLKGQDTYILSTLTNKIDELNNTTNLSMFNLRTRVTDLEGQSATIIQDLATSNVELNKVKLDTGITATSQNGSLPIPLSVKNAQTISMVEYGAIGDGVTDDTAAFALLEANVTGREIDLQGKTYKVNVAPTKNVYINGLWNIGGTTIPTNGALKSNAAVAFDVKECVKDANLSLYRMFHGAGRGGAKTMQSAGQDAAGNLYTHHNTQIDNNDTVVSVWNKYSKDSPVITPSTDFMMPEDRLGHQGIGILESKDNVSTPKFVTGSPGVGSGTQNHPNFDYTVSGRYGVVTFNWVSNTVGEIDKPVQYRVLEASKTSTSTTTPTITTDGKWLIIKYSDGVQNNRQYIRVFSTDLLHEVVDTDISNKYTHEFSFVVNELVKSGDTIHSLSGMCSDGNHLYLILAGWREPSTQPKYLMSCNLLGSDIVTAKGDMFESSIKPISGIEPTFIETEGLCIIKEGTESYLACVVISDTPNHTTGSRFSALYLLGAKKDRLKVNTSGINLYEEGATPVKPITIRLAPFTIDDEVKPAGLVIDNNGRGTGHLFTFMRNGDVSLNCYSSTTNVALTSPDGNKRLLFGATSVVTNGTNWNWFIDPANGDFRPYGNDKFSIGSSSDTVKNIYLQSAPIVSSDERLKQDFRNLKAAEKKAAIEMKESICLYKMKDSVELKGDGARWHVGVKAQQIVSIMKSNGLEPFDYGFICHDEWEAQEADIDDDGNEVQAAREAGDKYAIRYDELAMFILSAI